MWRLPSTLLVVVILLIDSSRQVRVAFEDDDDDTQVRLVLGLFRLYRQTSFTYRLEPLQSADNKLITE